MIKLFPLFLFPLLLGKLYLRILFIGVSAFAFSLPKRLTCYTARVFAVVSGVFKTRNPISMKRRNKYRVSGRVTLPCPRLRIRCLHNCSWSLSTYILEEKLSMYCENERERENHYRNSSLVFSHTDINTHLIGLLKISNILEGILSNFSWRN